MNSLYETIVKTNNVGIPKNIKKVTPIKGEHYFKGYGGNMHPNIDITSEHWFKVEFTSERWKDDHVAYFCTDDYWIIFEAESFGSGYAAVSVEEPTHKCVNIKNFGSFDEIISGAAIYGFRKIKTDLIK